MSEERAAGIASLALPLDDSGAENVAGDVVCEAVHLLADAIEFSAVLVGCGFRGFPIAFGSVTTCDTCFEGGGCAFGVGCEMDQRQRVDELDQLGRLVGVERYLSQLLRILTRTGVRVQPMESIL